MIAEESTRASAILRIALALVAWFQVGGSLHLGMARGLGEALLITAFYVAVSAMLVGWHSRITTAITGVCLMLVYHQLGDTHGELRRHQSWLLASAIVWLSFSPCGRSLSLDRWRAQEPLVEHGSGLGLLLIRLQVSVLYSFGALHKLTPSFLSGERLQHIAAENWFGSDVPDAHGAFAVAAMVIVALELALSVGLWHQRARRLLMPLGVVMHIGFALLLPVQTFSALMLILYLAFVPADQLQRLLHNPRHQRTAKAGA